MRGIGRAEPEKLKIRWYWYAVGGLAVLFFACASLAMVIWYGEPIEIGVMRLAVRFEPDGSQESWLRLEDSSDLYTSEKELWLRVPCGGLKIDFRFDKERAVQRRLPGDPEALARLLHSKNELEVECAAEALLAVEDAPAGVLPLIFSAAQENGGLLFELEKIILAKAESIPLLAGGLQATNELVCESSALLLGRFGAKAESALPELDRALPGASPELQAAMALAIYQISGESERTVPMLRRHVTATNSAQGPYVIYVLTQLGEPGSAVIPDLLELLKGEANLGLKQAAVSALGTFQKHPEIVVPVIVDLMQQGAGQDTNLPVLFYSTAAFALGRMGPQGVAALAAIFERGGLASGFAGRALVECGPRAAPQREVFEGALDEALPDRAALACDILAAIGPEGGGAIPALENLMNATDPNLRAHAAAALSRLGRANERVIATLVQTLASPSASEFSFATLQRVISTNAELRSVCERELASTPAAKDFPTRWRQMERMMSKRK